MHDHGGGQNLRALLHKLVIGRMLQGTSIAKITPSSAGLLNYELHDILIQHL